MPVYNFCAGPAMLPAAVMQQAQAELIDWQGSGTSVMEISHRSQAFINVAEQAEQDLRDLMAIPNNYRVLFMHGGGRGQFSAIPLNLSKTGQHAAHIVTGQWSDKATEEAGKYLSANTIGRALQRDGVWHIPAQTELDDFSGNAYLHYCPNETIEGLKFDYIPEAGDIPLVADMSSCILSESIDVSKFGVLYAGAQKNIGPSGLAVAIVREDLLGNARSETPATLDYTLTDKFDSMYNTPPTFSWYLAGLVFKWLKANGGVEQMQAVNQQKANLLYGFIDQSDFFRNQVAKANRSWMNVPFQLADASLDAEFLKQADAVGLKALKGHRSVGGMRASIYNAMPIEGVQALVEFMSEFERART